MALGAVLKDQARVVRREGSAHRVVDGTTMSAPLKGPWFRCRLELSATSRTQAPGGGPWRTVQTPTLMYEPASQRLPAVELLPGDHLEVRCSDVELARLADGTWLVDGQPEPYRKKRRVIGAEVTIKRAQDPIAGRAP